MQEILERMIKEVTSEMSPEEGESLFQVNVWLNRQGDICGAQPYWQYFTCPTPQAKSDLMAFLEIMSNAGFKRDER